MCLSRAIKQLWLLQRAALQQSGYNVPWYAFIATQLVCPLRQIFLHPRQASKRGSVFDKTLDCAQD